MALVVQKFGGTSVGNIERIKNVANRVINTVENGDQVVVVVSAMGKSTDELVALAKGVTEKPSKREMDMLLSTGEQVTISILAMALQERGYDTVSLTGWQAGIITEACHSNARIVNFEKEKITNYLTTGKIVIVAGFQGVTESGEITTLGRGGSDTTAVALAAGLKADRCDIFTDVTGVFTTDPRVVKEARKLSSISYDEMLELANLGAGVLHPRAVEFAKNFQVKLTVRSSMVEEEGTMIEEEASVEENLVVRGLAFESNVTKISVCGMPNNISGLSNLFTTLAANNINVDIIIQNVIDSENTNISFSINSEKLTETLEVLEGNRSVLLYEEIQHETGLAKVSIVGSGMISNPGVAGIMFKSLSDVGILIKMVSTSEIKVSTVIDQNEMVKAVETLHKEFKLDEIKVLQR
ncbi:aspartate kinase [Anaerobacillus alkalidiazotrophicus]|uniref:Aspartokinase n=1 Tax=Anaerobacillus alkalidiazotrophicus TaxID=472963 RepID=A0A1S2M7J2_9BACI|nr:aspartate kinase [Anaerobacillus alkalidiazotrophicus]OIJ18318.1 aspartate kinase [Anaerobacillus alkalidiazotrophicus]OIJ19797.1 aspartate kinase [Anaerobacillus alkalidiazotrophicus]